MTMLDSRIRDTSLLIEANRARVVANRASVIIRREQIALARGRAAHVASTLEGGGWYDEETGRAAVACGERCGAYLRPDPASLAELAAAYRHWRFHPSSRAGGCAHAGGAR